MTNLEDTLLDEMLSYLDGDIEETLIRQYFSENTDDYAIDLATRCNIRFPNQNRRVEEIGLVALEMTGNSEKYTMELGKKGYCKAVSYFRKNGLVVVVEDNGPGFDHKKYISEIQQGQIFTKEQLLDPDNFSDIPEVKQLISGGLGIRRLLAFSTHYAYNDVGNKIYIHFAIP